MLLKPSRFNFLLDDDKLAFNSSTCALVRFNLSFQKILQHPNDSLSVQDNLLRDQMLSCGFLVYSDLDELSSLRSRYLQIQSNRDTLAVTILPTDACNFNCFYCFQDKKFIHMSSDTAKALVNFIDSNLSGIKTLKVTWFGGEPLLAINLIQSLSDSLCLLANRHSCDYDAFIITNGYLLNDSTIQILSQCKIHSVQISLDGDKHTHDSRRFLPNDGHSFNVILRNLKALIERNFNVSCRINLDHSNLHSIPNLLDTLSRLLGALKRKLTLSFALILPFAHLDKWDSSICLSMEDFSNSVLKFSTYMAELGFNIPDLYPFYPTPKNTFCAAVRKNSFIIRPDGSIGKCFDCEQSIGDVFHGIAHDSATQDNLSQWLDFNPFDDPECKNCSVLPICLGGCPFFRIFRQKKLCLKWKFDLELSLRQIFFQKGGASS
ncbi:MAG: SPASM domain-containing protein [Selenomonadaceae bacterium]|nr:SPASM domain-containing protein [Selenomonadaceae bacterium]